MKLLVEEVVATFWVWVEGVREAAKVRIVRRRRSGIIGRV